MRGAGGSLQTELPRKLIGPQVSAHAPSFLCLGHTHDGVWGVEGPFLGTVSLADGGRNRVEEAAAKLCQCFEVQKTFLSRKGTERPTPPLSLDN